MGSLRNPVGPLPSSIYWRRRVVLLAVLALLALLITWVVTAGGGGGDGRESGANGKNPAPSITPGPSGSGPAISQAPGGRDESGSGGSGGSSSGNGDDGAGGDPADSGGAGGAGDGAEGSAGGGSDGSVGTSSGVGAADVLPAGSGSGLPNCTASAVKLNLRSARNAYDPGQTPTFLLTARNVSGGDCKVDLGPENTVLTITQASGDDPYWASDDCPEGARKLVFRVPAGESITYTVKWDRKPSAPRCATPPAGSAGAGTYLVEAEAPGFAKVQTSFVLEKD